MRRLMSLREARGEEQEEDSDDRSSEERSEANRKALGGEICEHALKMAWKSVWSYKRI